MKKVIKVLIVIIVFVLLAVFGVFALKKMFDNPKENIKKAKEVKHLDTVEGFDYHLYDNSTDLYKDLYYELKDVLKEEEINYEKYAELVAKLFIADYYTLSNKATNQDIGGADFFYSKRRENFKLFASTEVYKVVESNVYGERNQELPEVASFNSATVTKGVYKYSSSDKEDDDIKISISDDESYVVKLSWKYKKSYANFPTSATIRLVHEDKYLSVVSIE